MLGDVTNLTATRLGLHPWRRIAERDGGDRPARLKRAIVSVEDAERYGWMRRTIALDDEHGGGRVVADYLSRPIVLNDRIVDHIRRKPERAPYLAWASAALRSPLEVWRHHRDGVAGLEPRFYYLFAAARPELHSMVVIVGENDLVAFNAIPLKPKDAKQFSNR